VVLVGRATDKEIRKALQLLSLRDAKVVSGSGFTSSEIGRAQEIAKELGILVIPHTEISRISDLHGEPQNSKIGGPKNVDEANKTKRRVGTAHEQWAHQDFER
jgi:hypothetical protein